MCTVEECKSCSHLKIGGGLSRAADFCDLIVQCPKPDGTFKQFSGLGHAGDTGEIGKKDFLTCNEGN